MPKQTAYDFLYDLLIQLEQRKQRIKEYLKQEGKTVSKRDFTEADIEKINERIDEAAAAMDGILRWRAQKNGKDTFRPTITSNIKLSIKKQKQ